MTQNRSESDPTSCQLDWQEQVQLQHRSIHVRLFGLKRLYGLDPFQSSCELIKREQFALIYINFNVWVWPTKNKPNPNKRFGSMKHVVYKERHRPWIEQEHMNMVLKRLRHPPTFALVLCTNQGWLPAMAAIATEYALVLKLHEIQKILAFAGWCGGCCKAICS